MVRYRKKEDQTMEGLRLSLVCRYAEATGEPFLPHCGTSDVPLGIHAEVELDHGDKRGVA